ncbi:ribonuclease E/G [Cereibacter sp. SYSU M97828]|nr:ribonuclease E/G [Cereibacter flavus]
MKGRIIVLDSVQGRDAAALIVDGQLHDLLIDAETDAPIPGAIYRGVVDRLMKGQGGVFVKLPDGGSGFLRQVSGLAPGQRVLVQVTGAAEQGKATPVTTRLLFKSRLCILTPGAPGLNVSRRIRDEELREGLTALAQGAMDGADETLGVILRSACEGEDEGEIAADIIATRELAEAVLADIHGAPELLVEGPTAQETAWREWSDPAPDEVVEGGFADHGVLEMIDAALLPEVDLGFGSMVIEPTRALVAVDVNTGGDTSPAAGLKVNIAAARDLPRQLRLRGLGGQVVVDFAPMTKKDRATLDQVLRAAFKGESAETSLAGWTPLGLYELVRKRDRAPLSEALA